MALFYWIAEPNKGKNASFFFFATNLAIMLVLGPVASLLDVNQQLTANGIDLMSLLAFAGIMELLGPAQGGLSLLKARQWFEEEVHIFAMQ